MEYDAFMKIKTANTAPIAVSDLRMRAARIRRLFRIAQNTLLKSGVLILLIAFIFTSSTVLKWAACRYCVCVLRTTISSNMVMPF